MDREWKNICDAKTGAVWFEGSHYLELEKQSLIYVFGLWIACIAHSPSKWIECLKNDVKRLAQWDGHGSG